jgi:hypothetical protein
VLTVAAPAAPVDHPACRADLRGLRGYWLAAGAGLGLRDVLTALWCHADEQNDTFVSVRTLALEVGRSSGTVQEHLTKAVALGLVTAQNRGQRTRTTRHLCAAPAPPGPDQLELMVAALGLDGPTPCGQLEADEKFSARSRAAQPRADLRGSGPRVSTYLEDAEKRGVGVPWFVDDDGTAWPACQLEEVAP